MEGNLRFKINWASLIVRSKFTVFALFYFVFEGSFLSASPGGSYLEGQFNGRFLHCRFGRLIFGGAYAWRGLFSECYGMLCTAILTPHYIGFAHLAFHRSFRLRLNSVGVVRGGPLRKRRDFRRKIGL